MGLVVAAPNAHADRTSYYVTASGDVAATDNVFSAGFGNQSPDLFFQVRPGIRLTHSMPRLINDLEAEAELTQYVRFGPNASITGRASWQALIFTGPRSEMTLAANAQSGILTAITATNSSLLGDAQLQPIGKQWFQTADGSQYGSYMITRDLRIAQRFYARGSRTDDKLMDPTIVTAAEGGGSLSIERTFLTSSLALEAGGSVVRMERIAPVDAPMGSRLDRQYNPRARGVYSKDFDRRYSLALDAGAVYVIPFGTDPYNPTDRDRSNGLFPILGAQVALSDSWGVGQASLRRDVMPNLLVAQNTVSDVAKVTAGIPLAWESRGVHSRRRQPKLVAIGAVTALRTQLIDPVSSDVDSTFWIGRLDAGIAYHHKPGITYSLRYEFMLQSGGRDTLGGEVPGFFRNTVFFSFKLRYPNDIPMSVPKRRQNGMRSDRKDIVPLGAEPVIPELDGAESPDDDYR